MSQGDVINPWPSKQASKQASKQGQARPSTAKQGQARQSKAKQSKQDCMFLITSHALHGGKGSVIQEPCLSTSEHLLGPGVGGCHVKSLRLTFRGRSWFQHSDRHRLHVLHGDLALARNVLPPHGVFDILRAKIEYNLSFRKASS